MGTGAEATFVISWRQTEIGGMPAGAVHGLVPGATWRWTGQAARLDGPDGPLLLGAEAMTALRRRAARAVRRMLGHEAETVPDDPVARDEQIMPDEGFVVSDGPRRYHVRILHSDETGARMVLFQGELPPRNRILRITRVSVDPKAGLAQDRGVICFTPGTRLMTPGGARLIETLRPGDLVQTADDGALPVLWIGQRDLTADCLRAAPRLRPIRFQAGAFGIGRPDGALTVSPQHRMVLATAPLRALFNTDEALVAAADMVDGRAVRVDLAPEGVRYVHLLLERHSIVFANGLATESFHPAGMDLATMTLADRQRLAHVMPELEADPEGYGPYARRSLTSAEAAILRHDLAA